MSGIPSLTILSEEQKFNGDNLLQWNTTITQLLGSKGLLGYIDGNTAKPTTTTPSTTGATAADTPKLPTTETIAPSTPIYSSNPTPDEWVFRDNLARGHITLNCTDVASLGVVTSGTAKDAWDSIQAEWGKSTDMRRSHAQDALNKTLYIEGTSVQDHIKLLRTRKMTFDNLTTTPMTEETWKGIIIRSIPPTPKWLPVIPSLYSMTSSADIISTLLVHRMILGGDTSNKATTSSNTALAARTTEDALTLNAKLENVPPIPQPTAIGREAGRKDSSRQISARGPRRVLQHLALGKLRLLRCPPELIFQVSLDNLGC
jgi:hypothetical protein